METRARLLLLSLAMAALAGCASMRAPKDEPAASAVDPATEEPASTPPRVIEPEVERREIKVAKFPFSANGKANGLGEPVGFVKLIADAEHLELIGGHLIGPDVSELLPELTLAQKWDLTALEAARNVHTHPTLSEALQEAFHGLAGHMINL